MYQLMVNRKTSKKGFTLVEVIVVLVILAILAAIMIPAMTGWITEAKNKAILVNARTFLLGAQTRASEAFGGFGTVGATIADTDVEDLTGKLPCTSATATVGAGNTITKVVYIENGKTATYQADATSGVYAWTVTG